MKIKIVSGIMSILMVMALAFTAVPVNADNPLPPGEADQQWNPPEEGGVTVMQSGVESKSSSSSYYKPPVAGIPPYIENAYFIDESGQSRDQFSGEPFYLVVQTNSPGYLYIAEYYPAGSGRSPEWLVYKYYIEYAGAWTLGPFYPDSYEPAGKHTWKLWLYSSRSWARTSISFNYQPQYHSTATPCVPETNGWGTLQVVLLAVLTGALGVTTGMLIAGRKRYN